MADTVNDPQPKDPPDNQGGGTQATPGSTSTADSSADTTDDESDGASS